MCPATLRGVDGLAMDGEGENWSRRGCGVERAEAAGTTLPGCALPVPVQPVCVVSGSYFARDAAYSHHYSKSDSSSHTMFLARVLVGDFTRGNAAFVRPPAKEGQSNAFYDSCVNSMSDPTIFVVFEKHQVYPEYLIQYSTSSKPLASPSIFVTLGSLFTSRQ